MTILSALSKKIQNWIFTEEYNQEYRNATTKAMFISYCAFGGFLFDKKVQKWFRKAWIIYITFIFSFVNISCLIYFINIPVRDYYTLLYPAPVMGGLLGLISLYFCTYTMRDTFSKLFIFLDREPYHLLVAETSQSNADAKNPSKLFNTIILFCFLLLLMSNNQNFEQYVKFDNYIIILYPMYVPFERTFCIRLMARIIHLATILPLDMLVVSIPILLYATVRGIHERFVSLGEFVQNMSLTLSRSVDEVWLLETAMEEKRIPSSLSKIHEMKIKKALATDEFVSKTIAVVKQHQELHSMAKLYASKLSLIFSMAYVQISSVSIIRAFFIASITKTEQLRQALPVVMVLAGILLLWLLLCYIGDIFQNMNEKIASEFYNSPWYHLEPRDRRTIHTFVTIIQRPITIVVCELYSLNLFLFPNILNTIYNQVQVLRTLQFKKQKRLN